MWSISKHIRFATLLLSLSFIFTSYVASIAYAETENKPRSIRIAMSAAFVSDS